LITTESIECPAESIIIKRIRCYFGGNKEINRFFLEELWEQVKRPIGEPQSIDDHCYYSLTGCYFLLGVGRDQGIYNIGNPKFFTSTCNNSKVAKSVSVYHITLAK